jgi:hypothetical protein
MVDQTLIPTLVAALKAISAVRPSNWDDGEDIEHEQAWREVDEALAQAKARGHA